MAYLRCPDCRLTAHATAYFIQGDRCPRCLTVMEPAERFRTRPARPRRTPWSPPPRTPRGARRRSPRPEHRLPCGAMPLPRRLILLALACAALVMAGLRLG